MPSINDYKAAYEAAKAKKDTAGMNAAHAGAEAIRNSQGFSGGADGSKTIPTPSTIGRVLGGVVGSVIGTAPGAGGVGAAIGTGIGAAIGGDSNHGTPIIGGNEEKVQKVDPIQSTPTNQDPDIQQYIRDLADAHCVEDEPLYHPNLIPDDLDIDEEIFA